MKAWEYMFTSKNIIDIYKNVYGLPELEYEEQVSKDFFKLCNKKHCFAIISIYNLKNEWLLLRDFLRNVLREACLNVFRI